MIVSSLEENVDPFVQLSGLPFAWDLRRESAFAEFRIRLRDTVPVEIIELQSIEEPLADLTDVRATGQAVARGVGRHSPEGLLRLGG